MFNLTLCEDFDLNISGCSRKKNNRKIEIEKVISEIDFLHDLFFSNDVILNRILSRMKRILESEYFILLQLDPKTGESYLNTVCKEFGEDWKNNTYMTSCSENIPRMDNMYGHVLKTKKTEFSNNLFSDSRASCRFPHQHPIIKTCLIIPFLNQQQEVYAMLCFANKKKYSNKDIQKIKPIINVLNTHLADLLQPKEFVITTNEHESKFVRNLMKEKEDLRNEIALLKLQNQELRNENRELENHCLELEDINVLNRYINLESE